MGMPVNKQQVVDREERVWKMRMLGNTEEAIGRELGITQQAVSKILTRVYERKTATVEASVAEAKHRVAARLDWAAAEAAHAWEQSKEPAEVNRTNTTIKRLGKGRDEETPDNELMDSVADRHRDPEDVGGPLYVDEKGEEIPAEERARLLREAARRDFESMADAAAPEMTIVEERTQSTTETRYQTGHAPHMANFLKATEDLRQLYGLDAPKDQAGGTTIVVKVYDGVNVEAEV